MTTASHTHIFARMRDAVVGIVADLAAAGTLPAGLDTGKIVVEPPRDAAHGDIATNAAMVLAKPAGTNPRVLAVEIAAALGRHPAVLSASVAGPGFVNATLTPGIWQGELATILAAGPGYGASAIGAGRAVNVEYVSANPTGPMHVGHARGAVVGDVLASLLARTGFAVTREYYINDAGGQVDVLARSTHLRYCEALGEAIGDIPEGFYPGDYLKRPGADLAVAYGETLRDAPEDTWLPMVRSFAIDAMMAMIREDLAALGVHPDVFTSERALADAGGIDAMVAKLEADGLVYVGTLEPPKGKLPEDWEPRPQLLFRATRFGDDTDRPLKKSNGQWTYFAGDIAYHYDKYRRGFLRMIDVMGADHGGYVKRVKAAVAAVSDGAAALDVKLCQLVNLTDNGVPVKMSKRSGSFVTLRDVVEEVGRDVVRFIMLTRRNDQTLDFDFAKVREQTKDNPVFYVQYAHARVCSIFRRAAEALPGVAFDRRALQESDLAKLGESAELALIRLLAGWPRLLETAAETHEPHRVAFYLYDVATVFHALYHRGQDDPSARFILADDQALTLARLALAQAVADVVASGLAVLGVTPLEEMR